MYSGKHKTTGVNLQVICSPAGRLEWISQPVAGSVHDVKALTESKALQHLKPEKIIADKGYIGLGVHTPIRKPANGKLTEEDEKFNTKINKVRATVERVIANLKTWRILHIDYRRPFHTFTTTIQAVIALHFWKTA